MSNSVTNVEVEDVLNSIRRLVSQDPETRRLKEDAPDDRFILTPALRVEANEPTEDREDVLVLKVPCSDVEPDPLPTEDTAAKPDTLADDTESLEHQIANAEGDAEILRPESSSEHHTPDQFETEAEAISDAWEAAEPDEKSTRVTAPLEHTVAELEDAVDRVPDEWEPDGSEPYEAEVPIRHIFSTARSHTAVEPVDDIQRHFEPDPAADASDEIEEITEVTIPLQFSHSPEPLTLHEVADTAKHTEEARLDEQFIDEESLRELVSEIVRQELQGSMGERITRNVRRMVRREIQRTLSLKDFD